MIRSPKRRRTGYSSQRWPLPRRRNSFIWAQVGFSPTDPQLEYLRAFLTLLARRERPTLGRLAQMLGIRRQTVWQLEQTPLFRVWLVTRVHAWRLQGRRRAVSIHVPR